MLVFWQGEVEGCPFAQLSLRPDPAAVPVDDALDYGQADAGAFVFLGAVQPLEDAEQLVGIARIKPDPIILDVIDGFLALMYPPTSMVAVFLVLVYLMALPSKFIITWLIREGSPQAGGRSGHG